LDDPRDPRAVGGSRRDEPDEQDDSTQSPHAPTTIRLTTSQPLLNRHLPDHFLDAQVPIPSLRRCGLASDGR
jgi:hypothetical protein